MHAEARFRQGFQHPPLADRVMQQQAAFVFGDGEGVQFDVAVAKTHLRPDRAPLLIQIHAGQKRAADHLPLQLFIEYNGMAAHQSGQQLAGHPGDIASWEGEQLVVPAEHNAGKRPVVLLQAQQLA